MALIIGAAGGGLYSVAVIVGLQAGTPAAGSAGWISRAAIAYALGSLLAPSLTGAALAGIGVRGTLLAFSGLALSLKAMLAGPRLRHWRRPTALAAEF